MPSALAFALALNTYLYSIRISLGAKYAVAMRRHTMAHTCEAVGIALKSVRRANASRNPSNVRRRSFSRRFT